MATTIYTNVDDNVYIQCEYDDNGIIKVTALRHNFTVVEWDVNGGVTKKHVYFDELPYIYDKAIDTIIEINNTTQVLNTKKLVDLYIRLSVGILNEQDGIGGTFVSSNH